AAGSDPAVAAMIDDVVARSVSIGLVDDARYAETKAAALRRRGASRLQIKAKLLARGIDIETSDRIVGGSDTDEARAARRYAERRRLGPWRRDDRAERRDRDLAAMARAGFAFDLARRVIDGRRTDVIEDDS